MLECHFRRRQIAPSYPSHTANSDQAARCVHTPPTESHFPYGAISEGSLTAQLPPRDRLSNQPNAQDMSEAIRSCIQDFDAVSWSMVTLTTPSSATAHSKQEKMPPLLHVRKRAAEGPQLRRNYTVFFSSFAAVPATQTAPSQAIHVADSKNAGSAHFRNMLNR